MPCSVLTIYGAFHFVYGDCTRPSKVSLSDPTIIFRSYLNLFWEVGGLFTVLCSVASLLWLYLTPPWRGNQRLLLLMIYAFSFGASVGLLTKYLFEMQQKKMPTIEFELWPEVKSIYCSER